MYLFTQDKTKTNGLICLTPDYDI